MAVPIVVNFNGGLCVVVLPALSVIAILRTFRKIGL